jgi:hypothetical protein
MSSSEAISDRVLANRRKIGSDALVRFGLSGHRLEDRTQPSAERLIDALAITLKTDDPGAVCNWAASERDITPAFHVRELAHAMCMAVAAETAYVFRGSFREVMATLQRAEASIAQVVRESEGLRVAA